MQNDIIRRPKLFDIADPWPTLLKIWLPFVNIGGAYAVASGSPGWRPWVLLVPFSTPGWFYLASVFVRPTVDALEYSRAFVWRRIDYSQIVSCRSLEFPPGVGVIHLKFSMFPFGRRLFFLTPNAPATIDVLVQRIRDGMAGTLTIDTTEPEPEAPAAWFRYLPRMAGIMVLSGGACFRAMADPAVSAGSMWWSLREFELSALAQTPTWALVTAIALMVAACGVTLRRGLLWIPALLLGAVLGALVAQAVAAP